MASNVNDIAAHGLTHQQVITNGTADFFNMCAVDDTSFVGDRISTCASAAFAAVGSVMVIGGVTGNTLLIAVILRRFMRKRCAHNLFIVNLALADIMILGYWFAFFVLDMILGYHPVVNGLHCQANGVLVAILCEVSVTSLMCISLNRYIHVCRSHLYKRTFTLRTIVGLILGLWLLGLILVLPPAVVAGKGVGSYVYNKRAHVCSFDRNGWTYQKVMVITYSILPMTVIGLCNFAIFRFWNKARLRLSNRYALTKTEAEKRRLEQTSRRHLGPAAAAPKRQEEGAQHEDGLEMNDGPPRPSEGSCHSSRSEGEKEEAENVEGGESSASSRDESCSSYWYKAAESGNSLPCPAATVDLTCVSDATFSPFDGSDEETAFAAQVNRDCCSLSRERLAPDIVHRRLVVNVPRSQAKRDKQSFHILVTRASSTGNVHLAGAEASDRILEHAKNKTENSHQRDIRTRAGDSKGGCKADSRSSLTARLSVPRFLRKKRSGKGGANKAKGREIPATDKRPGKNRRKEEAASKEEEQREEKAEGRTSPEQPRRCSCKCWMKTQPADDGSSSEGELPSTGSTQGVIAAAVSEIRVEKGAVWYKAASMPALHLDLVEEEDEEEKNKSQIGCESQNKTGSACRDQTSGKTRSLPLTQRHGCKLPVLAHEYGDVAKSAALCQSSRSSNKARSFVGGLCGKASLTSALASSTSAAPAPRLLSSPASIFSRFRPTQCRSSAVPGKTHMYKLRRRQQEHKAREVAFVRSLFVVFILMFVCFIPYGLIVLLESIHIIGVLTEVSIFGNMCLFLNSSVNWIVYGAMNPTFRRGYVKYLRRLCQSCRLRPVETGLAGSLSSLLTASSLPRINWTEDARDEPEGKNN